MNEIISNEDNKSDINKEYINKLSNEDLIHNIFLAFFKIIPCDIIIKDQIYYKYDNSLYAYEYLKRNHISDCTYNMDSLSDLVSKNFTGVQLEISGSPELGICFKYIYKYMYPMSYLYSPDILAKLSSRYLLTRKEDLESLIQDIGQISLELEHKHLAFKEAQEKAKTIYECESKKFTDNFAYTNKEYIYTKLKRENQSYINACEEVFYCWTKFDLISKNLQEMHDNKNQIIKCIEIASKLIDFFNGINDGEFLQEIDKPDYYLRTTPTNIYSFTQKDYYFEWLIEMSLHVLRNK